MHVQKIVKKNRTCNKALNDLQIVKKNRKCKQGFKCVKTDKIIFYSKLAKAAYSKQQQPIQRRLLAQVKRIKWTFLMQNIESLRGGLLKKNGIFLRKKGSAMVFLL